MAQTYQKRSADEIQKILQERITTEKRLERIYENFQGDNPPWMARPGIGLNSISARNYQRVLKGLISVLSDEYVCQDEILDKFGKSYKREVCLWLEFLVVKGVCELREEQNGREYRAHNKTLKA
jgi:hypothetical protein